MSRVFEHWRYSSGAKIAVCRCVGIHSTHAPSGSATEGMETVSTGNTAEQNRSMFTVIQVRYLLSAEYA